MEKKPLSHIVAGVIIGAVMIIYSLFLQLADQANNKPLGFLSYLIIIAMLIVFILQYGKANNDDKTFGQLFSYGFKASAVSAILSIAFMAIFFIVFPEYRRRSGTTPAPKWRRIRSSMKLRSSKGSRSPRNSSGYSSSVAASS